MLDKLKAKILFEKLLGRPNIDKAYAMVPPTDSWYDTISKVHQSVKALQDLPHETLTIQSHDGLTLTGLYYPCDNARATMIWAHGYTSHALREGAFPALFYRSLGCNVLLPYQRAHGPSEGKYITFGALEHRDMMQWVDLMNQQKELPIIIHGLSMGGTIVLDLADQPMKNVCCLVADAPSPGGEDFFRDVAGSIFKKSKEAVTSHLLTRFQKEFGTDVTNFHILRRVANSRYPLFLAAGSEEKLEQRLSEMQAANPKETRTLILPGCNHGNGMYKQTELYQSALKDFFAKYMNTN